jgi:hypothetical protein
MNAPFTPIMLPEASEQGGGASSGPGSRPTDQANLRCPDATRVDPSRDEHYMLASLTFEQCEPCGGTGCEKCGNEGVLPVWEDRDEPR